jgi:predicted ABC-type ATPase
MPGAENEPYDFDDPTSLLALVVQSFEEATRNAAAENDALGIPSPVGVDGQVHYLQPSDPEDRPVAIHHREDHTGLKTTSRWMWIVAGPNGAGKTSFTRAFLINLGSRDLVALNADDRTQAIRPHFPEKALEEVNLMAAQQIDAEVLACIRADRTFLVETVLSSDKYRDDVLEARSRGFRIGLIYISLNPPALSPARVNVRVRKGGHDVAYEKAIQRHGRSHEQAVWFALHADTFVAFDNSSRQRTPILVATKFPGRTLVHENPGVNPSLDAVLQDFHHKWHRQADGA